jgi:hypothetical protein
MSMSPSERLARLRTLQAAAAATRQQERKAQRNTAPLASAKVRIKHLRLRELRGWLMTDAEIREHHRIEREDENDRQDERANDWTR